MYIYMLMNVILYMCFDYVYIYIYTQGVCMSVCVCVNIWRIQVNVMCLHQFLSILFLWDMVFKSRAQPSARVCDWWTQTVCLHIFLLVFYMGAGDLNSDVANTLLIVPSPRDIHVIIRRNICSWLCCYL